MIFNHKSDCTILFATPDMYGVVGEVIINRMSQCLQKNFSTFSDFGDIKGPSPLPPEGGEGGQGDSPTVTPLRGSPLPATYPLTP